MLRVLAWLLEDHTRIATGFVRPQIAQDLNIISVFACIQSCREPVSSPNPF